MNRTHPIENICLTLLEIEVTNGGEAESLRREGAETKIPHPGIRQ